MNRTRTLSKLVIALALSATLAGCGVNTIPTQDEAVKTAWAEVQNQYQRRSDLIPNLVATVKGYAAQESSVLVEVTQARAGIVQTPAGPDVIDDPAAFQRYERAQNALTFSLQRLQEAYPDLKSNANFMALQSQLEGTENRIAIARRDYNQTAQQYNTTLRTFPQVIWAKTLYGDQKPANLFSASAAAQTAPTVSFEPTTPPPAASGPPAPSAASAPPAAPK